MNMTDNTKRIVFVALAAILVLSIILPLATARFNDAKSGLDQQHSKYLWLAINITRLLIIITVVLWLALVLYSDWIRSRIDSIQCVARMKIIASVIWWSTVIILILLAIKFSLVLYRGSHNIIFTSVKYALMSLLLVWFLPYAWNTFRYFRTQPACNIIAASFVERHDKYVKKSDFDKAYSALLKACETNPDSVWFWCKLALFCEHTRKNSAEADKYMAKAEELITTTKATNISDKAYYLDYLGLINYLRGEHDKGLTYIKQAIDIEPKPFRIKTYEELLSDSKSAQLGTNLPDPKTNT
jgi:tetratricopeptide (TPR) repeat protein